MRGLEIGPLHAPRIRKEEAQVFYVDHTDAEGLRQKYAVDHYMKDRLHEIVEVDFVVGEGQELLDVVADAAPFDFVMASHLIEHIPDPVTWLRDIGKLLRPGGILSLIVPDKRYTFDVHRRTTEVSEIVDAHMRRLRQPSFRQVYDFISLEMVGKFAPDAAWAGTADLTDMARPDGLNRDFAAMAVCEAMQHSDEFVDVHCSVFTPDSFLDLYERLVHLDLVDFEIAHFVPTEVNDMQFWVSLRLLDPALSRESKMERQLASVTPLLPKTPIAPPTTFESEEVPVPIMLAVSETEQRWIETKRRILERVRRLRTQGRK
jgi:SAM-dependent methyltransferase